MDWLRRFMIGRNGPDTLTNYLIGTGFILSILSAVLSVAALNIMSSVLLFIAVFRMFSKNVYARRQENMIFLRFLYKIKTPFYKYKRRKQQKALYKFYKCPSCKQELRVPKGKGKIKITCPKCKTSFEKKV